MINIRNIVTQAYVQSQLISAEFNDELDGVRAETAVQILNQIVAQLNTSSLFPFTRKTFNFPVVTPQQSYTIGIDHDNTIPIVADIVTEKPEFIEKLFYKANNLAYPIEIVQCNYSDLVGRIYSNNSIGMPNYFAIDNGYPLMTIGFDLKPMAGAVLQLVYTEVIPTFTIDSVLAIDARYAPVLVYGLARHLSINQPAEILSGIDILYKENMTQLKNANMRARIPTSAYRRSGEANIYRKMAAFGSGYSN